MRQLFAVFLATLLIAFIGCGGSSKPKADLKNVDAKNLNLTVMDVNDVEYNLRQYLGKVVIIDFWDTWCGPCKKEIPHFVDLYAQYKDQGLEIVGVAFGRNGKEAVKQFGKEYKMNYTNAIFNDEAGALFGRPRSIPTTFIIDKKGQIADKVVGYRDKAYFENKIKELLAAS
jgi:thiol-disulfide isomerase/thioredoxin